MRKVLLEESVMAKISANLFPIEVHFYEKLMPHLGPFGPDCILARPNQIIMEDLTSREFSICDRRQGLDFDHTIAVIQVSI